MARIGNQKVVAATQRLRCEQIKRNGKRCGGYPLKGTDLCVFHTPGAAAANGKKGAAATNDQVKREKAQLEAAKLAAHDFITIESAALGISDLVDFGDYCKLKMGSVSEQFQSAWGRLTFDCLRLTEAAGIRYWVDHGDPLAPEGEIVPLPTLPLAEFESDD